MTKYLLIYLTPTCIYKCIYDFGGEDSDNPINFEEISLIELKKFAMPSKCLSGREQYEIIDIVRNWSRGFAETYQDPMHKAYLLLSDNLRHTLLSETTLSTLATSLGEEIEEYSPAEANRQAFLALKEYFLELTPNASRILLLNLNPMQTTLLLNEDSSIEQVIEDNFGIEHVHTFLQNFIKKDAPKESLAQYIKANLAQLVGCNLLNTANHLVAVDEETSRLVLRILDKEIYSQRIETSELRAVADQIIDSNCQHLSQLSYIEEDSVLYCSAYLILLTNVLEELNISSIVVSPEQRLKGHVCHKLLDAGISTNNLSMHAMDWQAKARELLLQYSPNNIAQAMQMGYLSQVVFDRTHELLHTWSAKEKNSLA